MKSTADISRRHKNTEHDTRSLEKQYTSRCGLKVCSYVRIMSPAEKARAREDLTEELVRILRAAGRL